MTEEERREMTRSNYAAQMEMLGYDASGSPLDMVHVVRCKDCKNRYIDGDISKCRLHDAIDFSNGKIASYFCVMPDFYCAAGERRESE